MEDVLNALLSIDDEDERYEAAFELARSENRAVEWANDWCQRSDDRSREVAQIVFGRVCPEEGATTLPDLCLETVPLIERAVTDPSPNVRAVAVYGLGHHGHPETIPVIVSAFASDPDSDVRAAAIWALGKHTHFDSIPVILSAVDDPSKGIRYKAAQALEFFYDSCWDEATIVHKPSITAALLRLMDDEDEDVRDWATFGIHQGGHDTPLTRARLWRAFDDPNYNVRGEAADGLAKFGDRTIIPRLKILLQDEDQLSPCFFMAAEKLQASELLPDMRAAAARWLEWDDGEPSDQYHMIVRIVEDLETGSSE